MVRHKNICLEMLMILFLAYFDVSRLRLVKILDLLVTAPRNS